MSLTNLPRQYGGKTNLPLPELDLLSVQKESYEWFLTDGVSQALDEISPVTDPSHKTWELTFGKHWFEKPLLSPIEAISTSRQEGRCLRQNYGRFADLGLSLP